MDLPREMAYSSKFAGLTSGMLVFLSAFRGDSRLILGTFRQEQVLALTALGLVFLLLEIKSIPGKQEDKTGARE